jgi:large subunit ribosomal protein L4
MVSLTVFNKSGKEVGKYDIDPAQIAPKISQQLLHDVVVMYQANQRQGTHRTKDRSDVAGTTKKMYRQKGTGNARAGSRRAPQRRGGYHVFALRPRDYSYRLPKKAVQAATRMAIAKKLQSEDVVVIDERDGRDPQGARLAGDEHAADDRRPRSGRL